MFGSLIESCRFGPVRTLGTVSLALATARLAEGRYIDEQIKMVAVATGADLLWRAGASFRLHRVKPLPAQDHLKKRHRATAGVSISPQAA
jgi:nuclear transport factor 2 (NTF2) superfamily protein